MSKTVRKSSKTWEKARKLAKNMSEIELHGAMAYLYQLAKDFDEEVHGESHTTFEDIDGDTMYCGRFLQLNSPLVINSYEGLLKLHSVFMLPEADNVLYGEVTYLDDEEDENTFVVVI